MSYTHSLLGFTPPARYDADPWVSVRVEESASAAGPFAAVETLALDPVDADPSAPASRNVTTDQATLESGYFRLVFIDAGGQLSPPSGAVRSPAEDTGDYVTPAQLRAAFTPALDDDVLPDAEALRICRDATTLVDDRLGAWPVDTTTGRKISEERVEDWQWAALGDATLELAKYLYTHPGEASEGRYLGTSGDVSTSGAAVDGPYGELFAAHLRRSQLVIGFTRARGGARSAGSRVWDRFARQRG